MQPATDILIAEDDENDRYLIRRAFSQSSTAFSFAFAGDGQEAIDYLVASPSGFKAKLLLLDLKMPRLDGFQVLEWLQKHPENRPARIVILTSSIDPRDAQRTQALGADLHLTKPHDAREYVRIAQGILDQLPESVRSQRSSGQTPSLPAALK